MCQICPRFDVMALELSAGSRISHMLARHHTGTLPHSNTSYIQKRSTPQLFERGRPKIRGMSHSGTSTSLSLSKVNPRRIGGTTSLHALVSGAFIETHVGFRAPQAMAPVQNFSISAWQTLDVSTCVVSQMATCLHGMSPDSRIPESGIREMMHGFPVWS